MEWVSFFLNGQKQHFIKIFYFYMMILYRIKNEKKGRKEEVLFCV
jgi:hypothetical protein